jgi:integrase
MTNSTGKQNPRLMSLKTLAAYLGLSVPELTNQLPGLQEEAFPNPVPVLGLWDRNAIDLWLDRMSGISGQRYSFHPPERQALDPARKHPKERTLPSANQQKPEGYTVAECLDDYMRWFRAHRRRGRETQYQINASILPHFGHRLVSSLTVKEIRDWHEQIAKSPRSIHVAYGQKRRYAPPPQTEEEKRKRKSTANRDLAILKAALNMAWRDGHIETDIGWRGATQFRLVEVSKAECLSIAECQQLLPHLSPDFRDFVRGALFTGARFAELAVLTAGDYDDRAGSLYLAPSKTFRSRHVILTGEGCDFFRRMTLNLHRTDLVFRRADGSKWMGSDCSHRLKIPCQVAGLRHVTFHMFRHTYASLLAMSGIPIAVIAKNLGHQNTETCEKYYAHFTRNYVADSIRSNTPKLGIDFIADGTSPTSNDNPGELDNLTPSPGVPVPTFTKKELLQRAKDRGIIRRNAMTKPELIAILGP